MIYSPKSADTAWLLNAQTAVDNTQSKSPAGDKQQIILSIEQIQLLADSQPEVALRDHNITKLFTHYMTDLAPWYDLNDPARTFEILVPELALQTPILFKAIIAFSACQWGKTSGVRSQVATVFHAACVRDVLASMEVPDSDQRDIESRLTAACLLRSFEIINGNSMAD